MIVLLFFALFAVALTYLAVASPLNYWKKRGVKYIKPLPFVGNTGNIVFFKKSSAESFQDFYNSNELRNEMFGGIFLGHRPCFIVRDLELIKKVLIKDFQYFSDRAMRVNEKIPLHAHLFNLNGWRWRALRIKLTPTFTSGKMKMMFNIMAECAQGLEKILMEPAKNGKVLEMKEPLAQFTTDIIGTCAFGLQLNSMENPDCEFRKMGRKIFTISVWNSIKKNLLTVVPAIADILKVSLADRDVGKFFQEAVSETVRYREENNVSRNDFLQLLIELKNKGAVHDPEGSVSSMIKGTAEDDNRVLELTDDLIAAQAFIFFIAGFETSSTTMGFALYELALNPDVQDKLVKEIRTSLEESNGAFSYDSVLGMKYLDMVVAETLRKYPPLGNLVRKVVKPYRIEGTDVLLEENMRVFIPVYAIQRDPRYYPHPEKFDPERFEPKEKEKRHPMTYMPFGDGPRNCIGSRFGLLQTKLGLCTLLNKFVFEVCTETTIPPKIEPRGFVTTLKGGIMLRIKERP